MPPLIEAGYRPPPNDLPMIGAVPASQNDILIHSAALHDASEQTSLSPDRDFQHGTWLSDAHTTVSYEAIVDGNTLHCYQEKPVSGIDIVNMQNKWSEDNPFAQYALAGSVVALPTYLSRMVEPISPKLANFIKKHDTGIKVAASGILGTSIVGAVASQIWGGSHSSGGSIDTAISAAIRQNETVTPTPDLTRTPTVVPSETTIALEGSGTYPDEVLASSLSSIKADTAQCSHLKEVTLAPGEADEVRKIASKALSNNFTLGVIDNYTELCRDYTSETGNWNISYASPKGILGFQVFNKKADITRKEISDGILPEPIPDNSPYSFLLRNKEVPESNVRVDLITPPKLGQKLAVRTSGPWELIVAEANETPVQWLDRENGVWKDFKFENGVMQPTKVPETVALTPVPETGGITPTVESTISGMKWLELDEAGYPKWPKTLDEVPRSFDGVNLATMEDITSGKARDILKTFMQKMIAEGKFDPQAVVECDVWYASFDTEPAFYLFGAETKEKFTRLSLLSPLDAKYAEYSKFKPYCVESIPPVIIPEENIPSDLSFASAGGVIVMPSVYSWKDTDTKQKEMMNFFVGHPVDVNTVGYTLDNYASMLRKYVLGSHRMYPFISTNFGEKASADYVRGKISQEELMKSWTKTGRRDNWWIPDFLEWNDSLRLGSVSGDLSIINMQYGMRNAESLLDRKIVNNKINNSQETLLFPGAFSLK